MISRMTLMTTFCRIFAEFLFDHFDQLPHCLQKPLPEKVSGHHGATGLQIFHAKLKEVLPNWSDDKNEYGQHEIRDLKEMIDQVAAILVGTFNFKITSDEIVNELSIETIHGSYAEKLPRFFKCCPEDDYMDGFYICYECDQIRCSFCSGICEYCHFVSCSSGDCSPIFTLHKPYKERNNTYELCTSCLDENYRGDEQHNEYLYTQYQIKQLNEYSMKTRHQGLFPPDMNQIKAWEVFIWEIEQELPVLLIDLIRKHYWQ